MELIAVKFAILTFTQERSVKVIHLQIDNASLLTNLVKIGCARSRELLYIPRTLITVEHMPSALKYQADSWSVNHLRDSSNWKLDPRIFLQTLKIRRTPQTDTFALHLNHQLPKYMSWHPDPRNCAVDFLQHSWKRL